MPHCRQNFSSSSTFRPQLGHQLGISLSLLSRECYCIEIESFNYHNVTRASNDSPDFVMRFAESIEVRLHASRFFGAHNHDHSNSHVESPVHIALGNTANPRKQIKHRKHRPRAAIYLRRHPFRQNAREVVEKTTPCNMSKPFDRSRIEQSFERAQIAAMRLQQLLAGRAAELCDFCVRFVTCDFEEQLSRKAVSICVQAYRRQSYQVISGRNARAVNDQAAIDDSDDKACDVVFAIVVKAGHLRSLASDQNATSLVAPAGETFNHRCDSFGNELSRRDVVEEEKGSRALNENVIDAMTHKVITNCVMNPCHERNAKLRAHSVSR